MKNCYINLCKIFCVKFFYFLLLLCKACIINSQVDSPELPETLEITEKTENFTKVTKYLTKLKETLINYVCEKSHLKMQ